MLDTIEDAAKLNAAEQAQLASLTAGMTTLNVGSMSQIQDPVVRCCSPPAAPLVVDTQDDSSIDVIS